MRRFVSGAAALLLLLSLSTLTGSAEAQPSPSTEHDRAAGRLVYYNGWGGLRLGMTHQRAWRTGMVSHEFSRCTWGFVMKPAYRDRGFVVWRDRRPAAFKVQDIVITGTQ